MDVIRVLFETKLCYLNKEKFSIFDKNLSLRIRDKRVTSSGLEVFLPLH